MAEGAHNFEIDLLCDGRVIDRGRSANVLDGPLSALRHLVGLLASDPVHPPLAAGRDRADRNAHARHAGEIKRDLEYRAARHRARRHPAAI